MARVRRRAGPRRRHDAARRRAPERRQSGTGGRAVRRGARAVLRVLGRLQHRRRDVREGPRRRHPRRSRPRPKRSWPVRRALRGRGGGVGPGAVQRRCCGNRRAARRHRRCDRRYREGVRSRSRARPARASSRCCSAAWGTTPSSRGTSSAPSSYHAEALALAEEFGFRTSIGFTLNGRAMLRRAEGRLDEAAEAAQAAAAVFRTSGMSGGITLSCASLGFIAELQGDLAEARMQHLDGLAVAITMGDTCAHRARHAKGWPVSRRASRRVLPPPRCWVVPTRLRTFAGGTPAGPASDVERITAAAVALIGERSVRRRVRPRPVHPLRGPPPAVTLRLCRFPSMSRLRRRGGHRRLSRIWR